MNPTRRILALTAFALVGAVPAGLAAGYGNPRWWALPLLAIAVAASETAAVSLSFGRQRWSFSCTDGAIAGALVLSNGAWAVFAVAFGALIAQHLRHQPRLRIVFNVAQYAAATACAAAFSQFNGAGLLGACGGMGLFWLINHVLVACAVSFTSGRRLLGLLWDSAPMSALHTAGNTSVGLLAAWLSINAPAGLLGLVVPMALLWWSYDQQTRRAAEARLFAELVHGQEQATGPSIDTSARVVLTSTARLFGGADVELIVLGADGPVRYTGDEIGVSHRERAGTSVFDEPWVLRALGSGGICSGTDDGRAFCSAVLGDREAPLALLNAVRPKGAAGFGRRETTLAQVLVGQAESWLSVADLTAARDDAIDRADAANEAARHLGDLGAHTAPSLGVLRESATRLARLASQPTGPREASEIVDELHSVERAVASLLGAIALAADPDLLTRPSEHVDSPAPQAAEWTTTGLLVEFG
jgi:hypothetical protein